MKTKNRYNLERSGQHVQSNTNRPASSPPVKGLAFTGRPERAWSSYDEHLGSRFVLSAYLNAEQVKFWYTGKHGGNAQTYTDTIIATMVKVKVLLGIPLRGVVGMIKDYFTTLGVEVVLPHYSTLSRRMAKLAVTLPKPCYGDFAVDSSGFGVTGTGEYFNVRFKNDAKLKFRRLHLVVCLQTGQIVACQVSKAYGEGSGESPVARDLVSQLEKVDSLSADRAYDDEALAKTCADKGGTLLCLPKSNTKYNKNRPHRSVTKHQTK